MRTAPALSILALLALAACAANSTDEDTIKIGFIGPLTGSAASLGETWRNAVELSVNDINANGGIDGKMLEIVYEDGGCTPRQAATAYQKIMNANDADAIVPYCSSEVLAIVPLAGETNTLVLAPAATSPAITTAGPHVFRISPSDSLQGLIGAQMLKDSGYTRVAVLYLNNDYGAGLAQVVERELGDLVVDSESFTTDSATDIRSQIEKIKNAHADAIYLASLPQEGSFILRQLKEAAVDVPLIGSEVMKSDETLALGEGILITAPSGEGEDFASFAAHYEEVYGEQPKIFDAESYDAIHLIALAAKNDPSDLVAGMTQITEYDGVAGHVVFDENGDVTKPYDIFTVRGGKFEKVNTITIGAQGAEVSS